MQDAPAPCEPGMAERPGGGLEKERDFGCNYGIMVSQQNR